VSTAFVAGSRPDPVAYEDELDPSHGFENSYERSKYEAEVLVREWSRAHSRPVTVLRPSILVTDRPPHPALPAHPLGVLARSLTTVGALVSTMAPDPSPPVRPTVRVVGDPAGHLNFVPVEETARAMVRLSERAGEPAAAGGVSTFHLVHDHDVPVGVLVGIFERLVPIRLELVPRPPADPSPLERTARFFPGFVPYLRHRRFFDDTRARTVLGDRPPSRRVDRDYLLAGIGAGDPPPPRLPGAARAATTATPPTARNRSTHP
jgi:nucleoside-diphosphate-sugar epimerase